MFYYYMSGLILTKKGLFGNYIEKKISINSWNTTYKNQLGGSGAAATPFRIVTNSGDLLGRKNYSCGGSCQTSQSKPNIKGIKSRMGHILDNCDNSGVSSASCNVKYVYDSSDYTRFKKEQSLNQQYISSNTSSILLNYGWFYNEDLQIKFENESDYTPRELLNDSIGTYNDIINFFDVDDIETIFYRESRAGLGTGTMDEYNKLSPEEKKFIDKLRMLEAAYLSEEDGAKKMKELEYEYDEKHSNKDTRVFRKGDEITVVHRGTQTLGDIATDVYAVLLGLTAISPRFQNSKKLMTELKFEYGKNVKIGNIGHSLGGTLAEYAGKLGGDVMTYNKGAGLLSFNTKPNNNQQDFRTKLDIVSVMSYTQQKNPMSRREVISQLETVKKGDSVLSKIINPISAPIKRILDAHLISNLNAHGNAMMERTNRRK